MLAVKGDKNPADEASKHSIIRLRLEWIEYTSLSLALVGIVCSFSSPGKCEETLSSVSTKMSEFESSDSE